MAIIIKPVITEKFAKMNEKGRYSFEVSRDANKIEIKKAIEKEYGVNVESVNTYITPGKTKTRMTKTKVMTGRIAPKKRAVITLAQGEVIDIYSSI